MIPHALYAILLISPRVLKATAPSVPFVIYALVGPREPAGAPIWKPFLKRRETWDRDRMRPVPVVFLRLAFSDQLSVFACMLAILCLGVSVRGGVRLESVVR